jgi:caffeoyl-CoA O-methyltransferase
MPTLVPESIEKYAREHGSPEAPLLRELAAETWAKMEIPQMQVGHEEGRFLCLLARLMQARRILEIGTFTGYSALCMAEGMTEGGELVTCDVDPVATEMARRFWARSPHGKKIVLKLGPALETLRTLEGPFDVAFLDADKENYSNYWEAVLPKMRPGGLVAADNVLWSGRVLDPREATDRAIAAFNELVRRDTRVECVMLTVRDGMTLAWKK